MDRMLELLEDDKAKPVPSPKVTAPAEVAAEKNSADEVPEPKEKDKTVLVNGCSLKAYLVTQQSYGTPQISDPVVAFVDKASDFSIGNFLATPASKTFESHQMGVKWEGYLWIDTPGKYLFSATCIKKAYGTGVLTFSLNGNNVLNTTSSENAPALGTITINTPGAYYAEVWIGCSRQGMNALAFRLEHSIIGAPKMDKISPANLYTKKQ
jgi:hypothetical protein